MGTCSRHHHLWTFLLAAFLTIPASAQTQPGEVVGHTADLELIDSPNFPNGGPAPLGDFDGDGTPDVIHGGAIRLLNPDGTLKQSISVPGPTPYAAAGDVDGDGVVDLACAIPSGLNAPTVWITFLNADGSVRETVQVAGLSVENGTFVTDVEGLGDLDGDGVPDLAVGDAFDELGSECGIAWVVFLNADGSLKAEVPIAASQGDFVCHDPLDDTYFGRSLAALGDLDGDGITELAVGGPGDDDSNCGDFGSDNGAVWIFFLNADGTHHHSQKLSAAGGGVLPPLGCDWDFGASVMALGDIDGDGVPDLGVGTPAIGFPDGGVYVLRLAADGTSLGFVAVGPGIGGFTGDPTGMGFAYDMTSPGDVNGDGVVDLLTRTWMQDSGFPPYESELTTWTLFLNGSTWTRRGAGLAGTHGEPSLDGAGPLTDDSTFSLDLTNGLESTSAWLVMGFSVLGVPFKGGLLHPAPDLVLAGLPLDGSGELSVAASWPAGLPPGLSLVYQYWIVDPAGPQGLSASNGLQSLSPP